jgi:hypothetical protein
LKQNTDHPRRADSATVERQHVVPSRGKSDREIVLPADIDLEAGVDRRSGDEPPVRAALSAPVLGQSLSRGE